MVFFVISTFLVSWEKEVGLVLFGILVRLTLFKLNYITSLNGSEWLVKRPASALVVNIMIPFYNIPLTLSTSTKNRPVEWCLQDGDVFNSRPTLKKNRSKLLCWNLWMFPIFFCGRIGIFVLVKLHVVLGYKNINL